MGSDTITASALTGWYHLRFCYKANITYEISGLAVKAEVVPPFESAEPELAYVSSPSASVSVGVAKGGTEAKKQLQAH